MTRHFARPFYDCYMRWELRDDGHVYAIGISGEAELTELSVEQLSPTGVYQFIEYSEAPRFPLEFKAPL